MMLLPRSKPCARELEHAGVQRLCIRSPKLAILKHRLWSSATKDREYVQTTMDGHCSMVKHRPRHAVIRSS